MLFHFISHKKHNEKYPRSQSFFSLTVMFSFITSLGFLEENDNVGNASQKFLTLASAFLIHNQKSDSLTDWISAIY